eukprot:3634912-Prymnesium_polylepis.1
MSEVTQPESTVVERGSERQRPGVGRCGTRGSRTVCGCHAPNLGAVPSQHFPLHGLGGTQPNVTTQHCLSAEKTP